MQFSAIPQYNHALTVKLYPRIAKISALLLYMITCCIKF